MTAEVQVWIQDKWTKVQTIKPDEGINTQLVPYPDSKFFFDNAVCGLYGGYSIDTVDARDALNTHHTIVHLDKGGKVDVTNLSLVNGLNEKTGIFTSQTGKTRIVPKLEMVQRRLFR